MILIDQLEKLNQLLKTGYSIYFTNVNMEMFKVLKFDLSEDFCPKAIFHYGYADLNNADYEDFWVRISEIEE